MKIKGIWLALAFLVLLTLSLCHESRAETSIEVGPSFLSHDYAGQMLMFSERVGRFDFGLGYVTEQDVQTCDRPDCKSHMRENIFVHAQRIVPYRSFELGIGPAYFQNTNRALGQKFTIAISVRWKVRDRVTLNLRHWSNAGSGIPNLGQDAITIGYVFK